MTEKKIQSINFDSLALIELPVTLEGKKYILREADGQTGCDYQNFMTKYSKFVDGKFAGIDGPIADIQPFLVSRCLFDAETNTPVPEATIRSWPHRVKKRLFEDAKAISDLDEADEETVKNDLKTMEVGSD